MSLRLTAISSISSVVLVFTATPAAAESVKPLQGQSAEQMQKDITECQTAATRSTGYNPAAPPPLSAPGDDRREEKRQAAAASAAQTAQQQAYQGCLAGKGYSVTP